MKPATQPTLPKRGRPRSYDRQILESLPTNLKAEGCTRTQMDDLRSSRIMVHVGDKCDEETQRLVLGTNVQSLRAGTAKTSKGFPTMAREAMRWTDKAGVDISETVSVIANARREAFSYADIRAHFRNLRLGKREGDEQSLALAIRRTVLEYRQRFPLTTTEQVQAALERVNHHIE